MTRPVIFLDLDDTMFTSVRYRPLDAVRVGAVDSAGEMSSYVTADQAALFDWMKASADIVATTGRGLDAFRRVALPLEGWAICMHGAVILDPAGAISAPWEAVMRADCRVAGPILDDLSAEVAAEALRRKLNVRVSVLATATYRVYLCIKHNTRNLTELYELIPWLEARIPKGWEIQANSNNVSVLPAHVSKAAAVTWLVEREFKDRLYLGVGDSLSDVPFMARCDFALLPTSSQVFSALEHRADERHWGDE